MSDESDKEYAQMLMWLEANKVEVKYEKVWGGGPPFIRLLIDDRCVVAGSLVGAIRKAWELEDGND